MSVTPRNRLTVEEYLALEETSTERHEYLDGEVFAMSGGTDAHDALSVAIASELRTLLKGNPCEARGSNLRVKSQATGLYTYADALIVCDPHFEDERRTTLLDPRVVVEVLSQGTEGYDRGEKFAHYRSIASVAEYVLVSTTHVRVEVYTRDRDSWVMRVYERAAKIVLASVGLELAVDDLYERVVLDAATPRPGAVVTWPRGTKGFAR